MELFFRLCLFDSISLFGLQLFLNLRIAVLRFFSFISLYSTTPRRFIDVPDPRFLGEGLTPRSVLFASEQDEKMEIISYVDECKTNGLSRTSSIMSTISITSPTGASISGQTIHEDAEVPKSGSTYSVDSDEETSRSIATKKGSSGTPKNKRKDQLRTQDKDKNRISFRLFKGNRKSQLHE